MTAPIATIADVIRTMDEGIARLEAAAAGPAGDDKILAWPNGLGVLMVAGESRAVSLDRAEAFTPYSHSPRFAFPVVMNGNRETAGLTTRREAIRAHLSSLRAAMAGLSASLDG